MYSYREFIDLQESAFMTGDEKLAKRNNEYIRLSMDESKKAQNDDFDVKIFNEKANQVIQQAKQQ